MKCADPVLCYLNGEGQKIYRNFSLASIIAKSRKHSYVLNCGQCIYCRKKRAYELACKCVLHSSLYPTNSFLTLTYDEKKPGYHNNFEYPDIQKFKKRLRRWVDYHYEKTVEVFNVHEYGKNGKKHWHLIVFNHDFDDKTVYTVKNQIPLYTSKKLEGLWPHGFNTIGDVTAASAMYQAQYVEKDFKNGNRHNSKKSHSKHSGIGKPYFLKHYEQILRLGYVPIDGKKLPVPRSFQKLAHKHYCHYYDPSAFHDNPERKALYRPFKTTAPIRGMADLFLAYKATKDLKSKELELEWDTFIHHHLTTKQIPDFIKSEQNIIHDLNKKHLGDKF